MRSGSCQGVRWVGGWAGKELWEETPPDPTLTFLDALVGEGQALSHWALVSGLPPLFRFG